MSYAFELTFTPGLPQGVYSLPAIFIQHQYL
jgi:hypothetical protein